MAYSDFTLKKVKEKFGINCIEVDTFVDTAQAVVPSQLLTDSLCSGLTLALSINSEKARSEWIIAPILLEIKRKLSSTVSLFSGVDFTVAQEEGLNGVCDFLISKSTEQLLIEAPAVMIVEAKREDLNGGIGQCIAEMVAAQKFNTLNNHPVPYIYGAVTSGDRWKFLKLENNVVTIGLMEHGIVPIDQVLGILLSFLS